MAEFETVNIVRVKILTDTKVVYRPLPCGGFELIYPNGKVERRKVKVADKEKGRGLTEPDSSIAKLVAWDKRNA